MQRYGERKSRDEQGIELEKGSDKIQSIMNILIVERPKGNAKGIVQ